MTAGGGKASWGPGLTLRPQNDPPDAAPRDGDPRRPPRPPRMPPVGSRSLALPGARRPGWPSAQRPRGQCACGSPFVVGGQTPGTWQVSDAGASRRHLGPRRALAHLSHFRRVGDSRKCHFLPLQPAQDNMSLPPSFLLTPGPLAPVSHISREHVPGSHTATEKPAWPHGPHRALHPPPPSQSPGCRRLAGPTRTRGHPDPGPAGAALGPEGGSD